MGTHFPEVGVIADVVTCAVLIEVGKHLRFTGEFLGYFERFKNRRAVSFATAEIVNFTHAGIGYEGGHEAGDIKGVDVVAHLFTLVAKYLVFPAFEVALHQVGKKAVEFYARVIRAGEAAAAQGTGGQAEVAAVFLDHDVSGDLRGTEKGVFGLIYGERFRDTLFVGGVGVVPAGPKFEQRNGIGGVAVNLVGAHVHERGFGAGLAGGFEKVESADCVGVEIVEGDRGRAVMRGLGGGMDYGGRSDGFYQRKHAGAVANIEFVVNEAGDGGGKAALVPAGVPLRAEEHGTLVVVHTVDGVAKFA